MSNDQAVHYAEILWQYHWLNQQEKAADWMIVLGSDDLRVAEYAADLFHKGKAKKIVLSGKANRYSSHFLPLSEAEKFAEVLKEHGVPEEVLFLEKEATNTGENILLSRQIIEAQTSEASSFLVVTKPYMERRVLATFHKVWPDQLFTITSPKLTFEKYLNEQHPFERVTRAMIGYVDRMEKYVDLGFQIPQEIPDSVKEAAQKLRELGFQPI